MSADNLEGPKGQRAYMPSLALGPDPNGPDSLARATGATGGRPAFGAERSPGLSTTDDPAVTARALGDDPSTDLLAALSVPVVRRAPQVDGDAGPLNASLDLVALWDEGADEPDYVVPGLIARGSVAILSGDTGAGKSWAGLALTAAVVSGSDWIGYSIDVGHVVYIDEENPRSVPIARLRALGVSAEAADRIRFYSRTGASVGDGAATDARLDEILHETSADLLVIDTATAATAVSEVNDNSEVVGLYAKLRQLAERHDCAILLLHHDRKTQVGEGRVPSGQSMMGARQWAGQADTHLAVKLGSRDARELDDGTRQEETLLTLSFPKLRDGVPPAAMPLRIASIKDGTRLLTAALEVVPEDERPQTVAERMEHVIVEALEQCGAPLSTTDLAAACCTEPTNGTFKRALNALVDAETVEKPSRGHYVAAPPTTEVDL